MVEIQGGEGASRRVSACARCGEREGSLDGHYWGRGGRRGPPAPGPGPAWSRLKFALVKAWVIRAPKERETGDSTGERERSLDDLRGVQCFSATFGDFRGRGVGERPPGGAPGRGLCQLETTMSVERGERARKKRLFPRTIEERARGLHTHTESVSLRAQGMCL